MKKRGCVLKPLPGPLYDMEKKLRGQKRTEISGFAIPRKKNAFHRALEFIVANPECRADELAEYMWPKSHMHAKVSNQGHGGAVGKAAWLCGGSLAGKLAKKGWVRSEDVGERSYTRCVYKITQTGREELARRERDQV